MFPIYSFPNNLYPSNYQPAPASLSRPYYDDDLEYLQDLSRRKAALEAEEQRIRRKYQLRDQQRARDRAYLESIREQEAAQERQLRLAQAEALRARRAAQQSREREDLVRGLFSREADLPRARADLYQQPYVQSYQPVYIQPAEELLNPLTGYGHYQAPIPLRTRAPRCSYDPSQQQASLDPVLETLLSQRQPTRNQAVTCHAEEPRSYKPHVCACEARKCTEPSKAEQPKPQKLAPESDSNNPLVDLLKSLANDRQTTQPQEGKQPSPSSNAFIQEHAPALKAILEEPDASHGVRTRNFLSALLNTARAAMEAEQQKATNSASKPSSSSAPTSVPAPAPSAAAPQQKREQSPTRPSGPSLKEQLHSRLQNEHETEIRDTIQAVLESLGVPVSHAPAPAPAPKPQSSASTNATTSAPTPASVNATGKGKETPSVPEETVSESTSADVSRALAEINSIESSFRSLTSEFTFPSHLDFSAPSQPSSPVDGSSSLIDNLAYTSTNAPVRVYSHSLSALLGKLDQVQSYGREDVRKRRKEVVELVEKALEELEWEVQGRKGAWERKMKKQEEEQGAAPVAVSEPNVSSAAADVVVIPVISDSDVEDAAEAEPATPAAESEPTVAPPASISPETTTDAPQPPSESDVVVIPVTSDSDVEDSVEVAGSEPTVDLDIPSPAATEESPETVPEVSSEAPSESSESLFSSSSDDEVAVPPQEFDTAEEATHSEDIMTASIPETSSSSRDADVPSTFDASAPDPATEEDPNVPAANLEDLEILPSTTSISSNSPEPDFLTTAFTDPSSLSSTITPTSRRDEDEDEAILVEKQDDAGTGSEWSEVEA